MKTYSTVEAADKLGVSYPTLHRWIYAKRFPVPPLRRLGRLSIRLWTERDLTRVRRFMERHYWEYRKGTGRQQKLRWRADATVVEKQR